MTNEKALEMFRSGIEATECEVKKDLYQTAIFAIEKQIPKKPKRIDKNKTFDGNWTNVCPTCGKVLAERITTEDLSIPHLYCYSSYCKCGQRLDWGDE